MAVMRGRCYDERCVCLRLEQLLEDLNFSDHSSNIRILFAFQQLKITLHL